MSEAVKKKSILIASPAYAGQFCNTYVTSILKTVTELIREQIPYGFYTIPTESLISRGRNRCAQVALHMDVSKLLFIDADMGWEPSDVLKLYYSDKAVVGGTAPMKQMDTRLVYNPLTEHIEAMEQEWQNVVPRSRDELQKLRYLHENEKGEVEMRHIGTGFMMIDTDVLKMLKPRVPAYEGPDSIDYTKKTRFWDFFPSGVTDEAYLSEDYGFCQLVRKHLDCGIWLNTNIICTHTGVHTYQAAPLVGP